ncbi:hypothetical protein SAMN06265379_110126 [Saccharicrinis carchari]|uniref:Aspartate kinase n=1 Tax=Saccharicrinis carchari TaxID=1168039 RepID=A0A521ER03_SACCC|nr:aspartate kinase [Saccharicrinis carchari]SMO86356.1 hypothetical protein SAMN06265379_110126 [Saccharicrinis carchari]
MITIPQAVESVVKAQPFISEALFEGLINVSSLARKIKPDIDRILLKDAKHGAIVMALNRLSPQVDISLQRGINKMINMLGDIIVRSDLVDYTFKNSDTLIKCHSRVFESLSHHRDTFYTMVRGMNESNIVISGIYANLVDENFNEEELQVKTENLSAITLKLHESNTQVPGFYYYILKAVAWEGINIVEVISTTNEFTVLVNDEDVDRAFSVLKNLKKKK